MANSATSHRAATSRATANANTGRERLEILLANDGAREAVLHAKKAIEAPPAAWNTWSQRSGMPVPARSRNASATAMGAQPGSTISRKNGRTFGKLLSLIYLTFYRAGAMLPVGPGLSGRPPRPPTIEAVSKQVAMLKAVGEKVPEPRAELAYVGVA